MTIATKDDTPTTTTFPPTLDMPVDEDADAQEQATEITEAARTIMRNHLASYLNAHGAEATFEGWISKLHPENIDRQGWVDVRLCLPGSDHRKMWDEATAHDKHKRRSSGDTHVLRSSGNPARSAHLGLVDASVGVIFLGVTAGATLAFSGVQGVLCGGIAGLKAARQSTKLPPARGLLRLVQGSLEVADIATRGAERLAVGTVAVAGGATCGLLALNGGAGRHTHRRLYSAHKALRWRDSSRHGLMSKIVSVSSTADSQCDRPQAVIPPVVAVAIPAGKTVDAPVAVGVPCA